jgi:ornithine--oxo-acid transaminase
MPGSDEKVGLSVRELVAARGAESLELWGKTINPQFTRVLRTIGFDRTWERGEGAYLWDDKGNRYLDMLGGFGMFNVGRSNPRVRAALVEALELDLPGSVQLGASPLPPLLAEALLARTPDRLGRVLFTSTGTEAVEAAVKLGRVATGRDRVVSLDHGFHGLTLGSLSANGNPEFTSRFGPLLPGFAQVRLGDLEALEVELRGEDVAVFLVEPIQGKGVHLAPAGYLEAAQELCRRYGTLFCVDEVQTGFGRTGKLFAFEHWGLEPDLVPVAKSLSGGYVPVGALLMSAEVHGRVFDSMENAFSHGSTFAPNELAMAAGLATLAEIEDQRLVERAATLGDRLLELTRPLVEKHEVVREVRGLGLMWAIEFVEPETLSRSYRLVERLQNGLFAQLVVAPLFRDHRVLIQVAGHGIPVIKGIPPLVVSDEDVTYFAESLDASIGKATKLPRAMAGFALTAVGIR